MEEEWNNIKDGTVEGGWNCIWAGTVKRWHDGEVLEAEKNIGNGSVEAG